MTADKPVVFFSHSSKDKVALRKIKDRFVELTGGSIEVFLSSDGQSIRLGSNWVSSIEKALRDTKIMFVFVSPNSLGTPWLYFETGHAYSKGIDVVPVGLFGVDVGALSPPMNLLQGFNLVDAATMNNILEKVNETFDTRHKLSFVSEDFDSLVQAGDGTDTTRFLGKHSAAVDEMVFVVGSQTGKFPSQATAEALKEVEGMVRSATEDRFVCPGASIGLDERRLYANLDPRLAHLTLPRLDKLTEQTCVDKVSKTLYVTFNPSVSCEHRQHSVFGRLGADVVVSPACVGLGRYDWNALRFEVRRVQSPAELEITAREKLISEGKIGELLDLLFEREVLSYES
jgi:hypothetical protein